MPSLPILILFSFILAISSRSVSDWQQRTIYQIVTDRFARTDNSTAPCANLSDYCGGTFQGIANNLDYIQGMGFDAIRISPVVANTPGGYHGEWAQNIYEINPYFGGADALQDLIQACHEQDIWILVDVAPTKMGPLSSPNYFGDKIPFNDSSYYLSQDKWTNGIPALDETNDFVSETLVNWIANFTSIYDFDGIVIGNSPQFSHPFWQNFTKASNTFTIEDTEVTFFNGTSLEKPHDEYEYIDIPFNSAIIPTFSFTTYSVFVKTFENVSMYHDSYIDIDGMFPDLHPFVNLIENQYNARFLCNCQDPINYQTAMVFTLTAIGVPSIYYGAEQGFNGCNISSSQAPLWTNMSTDSENYSFLATINAFRKRSQLNKYNQSELYYDFFNYVFQRGPYIFAFTNNPLGISIQISSPYPNGTKICDVLAGLCAEVHNGSVELPMAEIGYAILEVSLPKEDLYKNKFDDILQ